MNFKTYLKQKIKPLQTEIKIVLSAWEKAALVKTPELEKITKLLLETNRGGKNIRGVLICLGYDLCDKKITEDVYKVAAAYEILHTSLLIHDDVIDKSLLRRGKPTVYQELGGGHLGISQAICLGDVGFFLSVRLINQTKLPAKIKTKVINVFLQIVLDTLLGEILDIENGNKTKVFEKNILLIHELKTALYTIVGPLLLGAEMSGKLQANQKKNIIQFGKYLGIAYQIQDDILGVFGQEKIIGKSVTSDIEEGKNTLLFFQALIFANPEQKKVLNQYYGKGGLNSEKFKLLKDIFIATGSLDYSKKKVVEYMAKAQKYIPLVAATQEMEAILKGFVDFINLREK
ncbi:polyprenyl synthetase family protein [Candidatus Roizmanbacteria bacterium]|nr:polyprenyl synthetase family protein [Candidatus Roizmanbacteria bacterium]